ncbi:MAG: hypothetical protein AAFX76_00375 [Planctomycetota bacterium]
MTGSPPPPPHRVARRAPKRALGVFLLTASALAWAEASGQPLANASPGDPVDPNVNDVDPLAASFRRVDPGNAQHSFSARLTVTDFGANWSPFDPARRLSVDRRTGLTHSQNFQYRAPGVRALIDRPDYLVDLAGRAVGRNVQPVRDGRQVMVIPANTVFQLTPERQATQAQAIPAPHENYRDMRLNLRLARPLPDTRHAVRPDLALLPNAAPGTTAPGTVPGTTTAPPRLDEMRYPLAALPGIRRDTPAPGKIEAEADLPAADDEDR